MAFRAAKGTSSDLTSRRGYIYDVFLSFRGEDTRKTFMDHLLTALKNARFRLFEDDNELRRGEDLPTQLRQAIQQSRISVVLLSKDYASSRWCLEELVLILQRIRTTSDDVVLPLFYGMSPSEVRRQTGSYEDAFARYEETSPEKVDGWKKALQQVADLPGIDINQADGYESKFIQEIVNEIRNKLSPKPLDDNESSELFNGPAFGQDHPIEENMEHSLSSGPLFGSLSSEPSFGSLSSGPSFGKDHPIEENMEHPLSSGPAFGQDHPIEENMEHSKMVGQHGGRLPSAVEVIPNGEIMNEHRISIKSSKDDHDRKALREKNANSAEWIFLATTLCMEILSAICEQASSPSRPQYALFSMLLAIATLLTGIWELIYKGMKKNVVWGKMGCHMLFGSDIELFVLVGGIVQCACSIIQYVYYIRHAENPIKMSLLPAIFLMCLIATRLCRTLLQTTYETGEHTTYTRRRIVCPSTSRSLSCPPVLCGRS